MKNWGGIQLSYVDADQSVKLKRLGFNSWCDATWTQYKKDTEYNKKGFKFEEGGILKGTNEIHGISKSKYYEIFSAPTISLALLWLEETHKIYVGVTRASGLSWLEVIDEGENNAVSKLGLKFGDKEKAESAGLDLALEYLSKKIKIK